MNCIIIDDEATSRTIIGELCSSYKNLNVVEVFSNAIEAIKYLNQNKTDFYYYLKFLFNPLVIIVSHPSPWRFPRRPQRVHEPVHANHVHGGFESSFRGALDS